MQMLSKASSAMASFPCSRAHLPGPKKETKEPIPADPPTPPFTCWPPHVPSLLTCSTALPLAHHPTCLQRRKSRKAQWQTEKKKKED
ncbi:hypothetical protein ES319_D02G015000v1 [Gossypium barbadense]|uniref:Uncharacterized protein n=1 Tax=Gossypium barbadense TaxID=3634 RepID=A0A5J5SED7_GOSBA|nr:hypothetical protein ES319_D02G015000v1 [Gossypium barbadense]